MSEPCCATCRRLEVNVLHSERDLRRVAQRLARYPDNAHYKALLAEVRERRVVQRRVQAAHDAEHRAT